MISPVKRKASRLGVPSDFSSSLAEAGSYEQLLRLVDFVEAHKSSVLATIKEKIRSFSNWPIDEVRQYFHIADKIPMYTPDTSVILPEGLLDRIKDRLYEDSLTNGPCDEGSEARRKITINAILGPIALIFAGNIMIRYEQSLDSRVEYVLYAIRKVIMHIIEAKKEDLIGGKAKLFLQLNAFHWSAGNVMNSAENTEVLPLCGIVTTGRIWQFFEFNGSKVNGFKESSFYDLETHLVDVVRIIFAQFMRAFRDSAKALRDVWHAEIRPPKTVEVNWTSHSKDTLELFVGDTVLWESKSDIGVVCMNPNNLAVAKESINGIVWYSYTFADAGEFQFVPHVLKERKNRSTHVIVDNPQQDFAAADQGWHIVQKVYQEVMSATEGATCAVALAQISTKY